MPRFYRDSLLRLPPPPIRTLLEDKEDGKDYSEVIKVLKQYIKSQKRVIASQSSDIKTLLLSLNTLKASIKDSVSAIKNISSTLASLTNSSNTAATGKTSYSPRFDPFSGTIDLDSPPHPPRKEPYLGPAIDNTATSNLDPPIDTGSKEGFKDTINSSIVKELSKKAYTTPDNSKLSRESNFEQWIQALKSKKEDVYNEFHVLTFSTYKKGLLAFNAKFNSYLAKLTIAKIDIDPSLILNLSIRSYCSIFTAPLAPAPTPAKPAKPAKITPAIRRTAAYEAKQRESAKARAIAGYNAGRYTTNSSLIANRDDNNAYNKAYMPPTNMEEEKGGSSNNNSVNSSTSDSADKGKDSSIYKRSKGASRCKDTPLYKR
ncbi:hypothetical protein P8C59_005375 [Phyllachora maydis]|uniref:Uncharacterized protein n=1 Tax=Phyllachora maydis TaxID=1825666 RepID=A0AAD9I5C6_9PEZI|nr:hypothetical protein P8C59_005375 [Phyllachora maydis]